ncbi:MAG TPA: FIST N-terminal domain-containing protein [Chitinophagaceae bacterium]|nr:FIST N-terminal domain-containing protein [Chitinophagaceae bacterium]
MKAISIKGKSPQEIGSALQQAMADGFKPTLALVFMSIKQDRETIIDILDGAGLAIYGTTTNGEFIDEAYEQGTIVMMVLDINPDYFLIQYADLNGKDDRNITTGLATEALAKFPNPAFLVTGSNLQTDIEEIIGGITDVIPHANITGGMAGDDHTFTEQYVFTNNAAGNRAVLTLVFNQDKILMKGRASHGWKPLGTDKTITKSEGNRIYTIDGVPTLDLCLRYSGLSIDDPNLTTELLMNCPFQLQRDSGTPLMRPAYHIFWEDHSMLTSGKVPEGSKIRFSLPPDFDVIEKVIEENKKFKEIEMPDAEALIVYNCGGRMMCFGPLISEELKGMKQAWNVPMAGMFSNAEIGPTRNGRVEMHNLTTCWVALKEK